MKALFKIFLAIVVVSTVVSMFNILFSPSDEHGGGSFLSSKNRNDGNSPSSDMDYSSYPAIEDLTALRDLVIDHRDAGMTEFSFIYSGEDTLEPLLLAEIYGASHISWTQEENVYHVTMTEFPGDRIVDAYRSGDDSELSRDERRAMEKAVEMVEEAKKQADTQWELEKALYELICEEVAYYTEDLDSSAEGQPRFVSVVGAFLDGRANCQGYTDAFYTVASIAGFQVGRLAVDTSDLGHMVNTVCIDGAWYIVDVTYGDSEEAPVNYRLLNAGMDVIGEYWWDEEMEPYPIADETDMQWYYYAREDIVYEDIYDLAEAIASEWDRTGEEVFHAMLLNETDGEKLSDILYDALEPYGKAFSYRIYYHSNETDSYYSVVFSK